MALYFQKQCLQTQDLRLPKIPLFMKLISQIFCSRAYLISGSNSEPDDRKEKLSEDENYLVALYCYIYIIIN